jgi:putative tryptophan/tyrosine transport system substrate-binding protein
LREEAAMLDIGRREFMTMLGGAAAAWPFAARAQQPAMPVVGFLSSGQPQTFAHMIDAFRQGLSQTGYVVGQNVTFEHLAAGSEYDRFRAMADDLVRRQVAVIFATGGTAAALAARTATSTIPIVFYMGGDPVQQGLVASLGRPGGNLTGFSWLGFALAAKRLELLRELLPNGAMIGMLVNPANPDSDFEMRDVQDAARILGRQIHNLTASSDSDFDGVFATLVKQQMGALIVASDAYFSGRRGRIVALAARHGVAAIYERREFPDAGGLISYGHHRADAYRQLGVYTGRILKGTKPAELPVLQPTKFELVINLNAAKALGIEISPKLLALADEVIE